MLQEIRVEHYAVVDKLSVRFRHGLNLLTGETGSGKSIVVDALSLLLGARASVDVIRAGYKRARITGVFEVEETPELRRLLDSSGLDLEENELVVERELLDSGKSRAYVNGRFVPLSLLRELAGGLADIHGQHEQQDLFHARTQLAMLDAFADQIGLVSQVAAAYRQWKDSTKRLDELRGDEKERLRLLDLYRFQHQEIEQAKLEPGEDDELQRQSRLLAHAEQVKEAATRGYDLLYESPASAATQLQAARRALEELAAFDPSLHPLSETLENARAQVEDAALELSRYRESLEFDPRRQAEVEDRLAAIEKLKRKYGATVDEVLAYGEEVGKQLEQIESLETTIAEVEKRQRDAAEQYTAQARKLSAGRREAAGRLGAQVKAELASLAMEAAEFQVAFDEVKDGTAGWSAAGIDRIRFLASANPGQPPRPVAQAASGGELSRIALALKTCLTAAPRTQAENTPPRTLVFDEIDSGVGGRVAEALGRRLKRLGRHHQVLCVTHLPQIAGFADAHYFVEKRQQQGSTFASVVELSKKERAEELARMLSGAEVTTAALRHARQILNSSSTSDEL